MVLKKGIVVYEYVIMCHNNGNSCLKHFQEREGEACLKLQNLKFRKEQERFNLYLGDCVFEMGIDIDTLVKFNLKRSNTRSG